MNEKSQPEIKRRVHPTFNLADNLKFKGGREKGKRARGKGKICC